MPFCWFIAISDFDHVAPGLSGSSLAVAEFTSFAASRGFAAGDSRCSAPAACCAAIGNTNPGSPATTKPVQATYTTTFFHASMATSDAQMNYLASRLQIRQCMRDRVPGWALGLFDGNDGVETPRCFVSGLKYFEEAIDAHKFQNCRRCRRE